MSPGPGPRFIQKSTSMPKQSWLAIRKDLSPRRRAVLGLLAFLLPVALWCLISYVPFLWHPMIKVEEPGDVTWFKSGLLIPREDFAKEVARVETEHGHLPTGSRANPIFLPAPHA